MLSAISFARRKDSAEGLGGRGVVYKSTWYVLLPLTRSLFASNWSQQPSVCAFTSRSKFETCFALDRVKTTMGRKSEIKKKK